MLWLLVVINRALMYIRGIQEPVIMVKMASVENELYE